MFSGLLKSLESSSRELVAKAAESAASLKAKAIATHAEFLAEKARAMAQEDAKIDVGESPLPWLATSQSMVQFEPDMRAAMLALSKEDNTFLHPPPLVRALASGSRGHGNGTEAGGDESGLATTSPSAVPFDMAAHVGVAAKLLSVDPSLSNARFRLVPKRVKEELFWENYFAAVARVRADYRARADAQLAGRAAVEAGGSAAPVGCVTSEDNAGLQTGGTSVDSRVTTGDGSDGSVQGGGAVGCGGGSGVLRPTGGMADAGESHAPIAVPVVCGSATQSNADAAPASVSRSAVVIGALEGSDTVGDDFVDLGGGGGEVKLDDPAFEAALARALTADDGLESVSGRLGVSDEEFEARLLVELGSIDSSSAGPPPAGNTHV